jgi:hypothetical protein
VLKAIKSSLQPDEYPPTDTRSCERSDFARYGVQKWTTESIKIAASSASCLTAIEMLSLYIHADIFGAGQNGCSFLQELSSHSRPTPKRAPFYIASRDPTTTCKTVGNDCLTSRKLITPRRFAPRSGFGPGPWSGRWFPGRLRRRCGLSRRQNARLGFRVDHFRVAHDPHGIPTSPSPSRTRKLVESDARLQ